MAADRTLVEGAYRASRHIDMGKSAAQKDLGDTIAGTVERLRKERDAGRAAEEAASKKSRQQQEDVDQPIVNTEEEAKITEDIINEDPVEQAADLACDEGVTLDSVDDENMASDFEMKKLQVDEAILGDDKVAAARITANVEQLAGDKEGVSNALASMGENYGNRGKTTAHGYGMNLENNPDIKMWMEDLILSKGKLEISDDGERYGVTGPDGNFMTPNQLEEYLVQFEVDNESFNAIDGLAEGYRDQGAEGTEQFDRDKATKAVEQIVDSGNIQSIMHDSSFGGRSFVDDLIAGDELNGISYANLNLVPPEDDVDGVIGPDDNISEDLKRQIVNNFTTSKEYADKAKGAAINYYTDYLERNYNKTASKVEPIGPASRFDLFGTQSGFTNKQTQIPNKINMTYSGK